MPYPSIEPVLAAWLNTQLSIPVVEQLPFNTTFTLPLISVERLSGSDSTLTLDEASIDVDVFASTRDSSRNIAELVREALRLRFTGYTSSRLTITRVETVSGPAPLPWSNEAVWRFGATYRIVAHSRP